MQEKRTKNKELRYDIKYEKILIVDGLVSIPLKRKSIKENGISAKYRKEEKENKYLIQKKKEYEVCVAMKLEQQNI